MERPQPLPDNAPTLTEKSVTLIAILSGDLVFATTVGSKERLLDATTGDLWAVWTGRWRSDLFTVTRTRVEADLN